MKSKNPSLRSWILAITAGATLAANAVEYTYDASPNAGIQTINGNWATGATNWTTDGGATRVGWPNTGTDSAYITGTLANDVTLNINSPNIQLDDLRTDYTGKFGFIRQLNAGSRTLTLTGGTYDGTGTTGSQFIINGWSMEIVGGTQQVNVAGTSDLVKKGPGLLFLSSTASTFTGNIHILEGTITLKSGSDASLGNAANDIFLDSGTLKSQTTALTLGSGRTITLQAAGGTIDAAAALTLQGPISGPGALIKVGSSDLNLEASSSYGGATTINSGVMRLQANGTIPSGSNLTINGSGNFNARNTIGWVHTGTITGDGTGQINLNFGTDAELAGPISGVLTINANSAATNTTISGNISGPANVNVQNTGAPILRLSGTNTYTGTTTVAGGGTAGTLIVDGDNSGATGNVAINGGTLTGTGTIGGAVTVGATATLAPGSSIESLATGALVLQANSTYAYEINNDAAASVAGDLTAVTGDLTIDLGSLANLTLSELGAGSWTLGEKLTLISYSGAWNGGLFNYSGATLADDSTFSLSGMDWLFNYDDNVAGTNFTGDLTGSKFVTMTAIPEPAAALLGSLALLVLLRRRR